MMTGMTDGEQFYAPDTIAQQRQRVYSAKARREKTIAVVIGALVFMVIGMAWIAVAAHERQQQRTMYYSCLAWASDSVEKMRCDLQYPDR